MTHLHPDETPHTLKHFSFALGFSLLVHALIIAPVFFPKDKTVWSVGAPIAFELEAPAANSLTPAESTPRDVTAAKTPKASTPRTSAPAKIHAKPETRAQAQKLATNQRATEPAHNETLNLATLTESPQATATLASGTDFDYHPPRYREGSAQNPKPDYPYLALLEGWKGRVVLQVQVDTGGQVLAVNVHQSSGYDLLDQAARETITRWVFTPAQRKGRAVVAQVDVPIRFELE